MDMETLLQFFATLFLVIVSFLLLANAASVVGYVLHRRRTVDRIQRRLASVIALFRIGVR
ncbi:hypothetical protein [Sphingosinithalassobacter portus]|uniref:hypothetical protein n=1 Tax=Stakelama portus TaxID=2676234 RepID=UPI0011AB3A46|nr:hypothetical protein [Sphingosinithalassobacter portus]